MNNSLILFSLLTCTAYCTQQETKRVGAAHKETPSYEDFQDELRQALRRHMEKKPGAQPPQAPAPKPTPAKKAPQPAPTPKAPAQKAAVPAKPPIIAEPLINMKQKLSSMWNAIQGLLIKHKDDRVPAGRTIWDGFNTQEWQAKEAIFSWDMPVQGESWATDVKFGTFLDVYLTDYTNTTDRAKLVAIVGALAPTLFNFGPTQTEAHLRTTLGQENNILRTLAPATAKFLEDMITQKFAPKPRAPQPVQPSTQREQKEGESKQAKDVKPTKPPKTNGKQKEAEKQKKIETCLIQLRKKYEAEFEKDRKANMDILFEITNTNQDLFDSLLTKNRAAFEAKAARAVANLTPLPSSSPYYALCRELLSKNGIKPDSIKLFDANDATLAAAATYNALLLNVNYLNGLSPNVRKFAILHEIGHIKYDDSRTSTLVDTFLLAHALLGEVPQLGFTNLWRYFEETRADIFAALFDLEAAQGYLDFFEVQPETEQYITGHSHLHHAQRAALAADVLAKMLQCYE